MIVDSTIWILEIVMNRTCASGLSQLLKDARDRDINVEHYLMTEKKNGLVVLVSKEAFHG